MCGGGGGEGRVFIWGYSGPFSVLCHTLSYRVVLYHLLSFTVIYTVIVLPDKTLTCFFATFQLEPKQATAALRQVLFRQMLFCDGTRMNHTGNLCE